MTVLWSRTNQNRQSGFQVFESFSLLMCTEVSFYFSLCSPFCRSFFFLFFVTDTPQYFAVLSSAQKNKVKLKFSLLILVYICDSMGFTSITSPASLRILWLLFPLVALSYMLIKSLKSNLLTDLTRQSTTKIIVVIHTHKKKLTSVQCNLNGLYRLIVVNAWRLTSPCKSTAKVKAKLKSTPNYLP